MADNSWLTGYLQQKSQEDPIGDIRKALLGLKGGVDTAANYYSGLPDALNPNKPPVPLEDLASEAIFPGSTQRGTTTSTPNAMASSALNAILGTAGDPTSYMGGSGKVPLAGILNEEGENVAFHGTPHDFDKFDINKIGTGEGAQAYGHGMYFADDPGIAEGYRKRLSGSKQDPAQILAKDTVDLYSGDTKKAQLALQKRADRHLNIINNTDVPEEVPYYTQERQKVIDAINHIQRNSYSGKGNFIGAKLPSPDKFLDYDATLKDLPPEVADKLPETDMARRYEDNYTKAMHDVEASLPYLSKYGNTKEMEDAIEHFKTPPQDPSNRALANYKMYPHEVSPITENMYKFDSPLIREAIGISPTKDLANPLFQSYAGPTPDMPISSIDLGPEGVKRLSDSGIAGVKYLDANSRPTRSYSGVGYDVPQKVEPKYNYVVFNPEKDAQIMGKLPSPTKEDISHFLQTIMKVRPY